MSKQLTLLYSIVGFLIIGFSSCGGEEDTEVIPLRPVLYQSAQLQEQQTIRTFNGIAQTDKIINLSFRTNGILDVFDLKLGQTVKRGDLLGKLDNVQSRLAYEQSISSLKSAESQMKTAKLNYDRIRSLYEKGSASLSEFENAKNSFQTAESSFESAERSVSIQQEQINFGIIRAPQDGVITSVDAELGENISPGQVIGILNAGDLITIELGLPESVINAVNLMDSCNIQFPAISGRTYHGIVSEVSPAINVQTSTYPIKVTLLETGGLVKSGMAAYVELSLDYGNRKAVIVPAQAVGEDSKGRFVFAIDRTRSKGDTGNVVKKYVQIGELTPNGFEVMKGLQKGEEIATAGLQTLLDNQQVILRSSSEN